VTAEPVQDHDGSDNETIAKILDRYAFVREVSYDGKGAPISIWEQDFLAALDQARREGYSDGWENVNEERRIAADEAREEAEFRTATKMRRTLKKEQNK
jgi:hypothetical protein